MTAISLSPIKLSDNPQRGAADVGSETATDAGSKRLLLNNLLASGKAEYIRLTHGVAYIVAPDDLPPALAQATALGAMPFDHRYFDVIRRSLSGDFSIYFALVCDLSENLVGIQPFFFVRQNLLAGLQGRLRRWSNRIQKRFPRFLTLKMLMVGNPAGPAALGVPTNFDAGNNPVWFTTALSETMMECARRKNSRIIVFKDFPADTRPALERLTCHTHTEQYGRLPSMPMTSLDLQLYDSFEQYMQNALSKSTRKNLRRKFRDAADANLTMSVTNDVSDCIDELYPLYLQVYERAKLHFEKLTPEFFIELGRRMPERARFFIWRLHDGKTEKGRMVAFSATLFHAGERNPGTLYDLYLGLEYPIALDLHLYFVTMRDVLDWAIEHRVRTYVSTPLSYEAKLHFRHQLVPLDLYVRHTSPWLNPFFKFAMRFAEPTRHDKILPQFPNARDMTG